MLSGIEPKASLSLTARANIRCLFRSPELMGRSTIRAFSVSKDKSMNNSNPLFTIFVYIVLAGFFVYGVVYLGAAIAYVPFSWAVNIVSRISGRPVAFLYEEMKVAVERDTRVSYSWRKDHLSSRFVMNVDAENNSPFPIKKFQPDCRAFDPAGRERRISFDFTSSRTSLDDRDQIDTSILPFSRIRYTVSSDASFVENPNYKIHCVFVPSLYWWIWISQQQRKRD
jgi:hypothetical protein